MTPQLANAPADVIAAYKRLTKPRQAFALALPTASSQETAMLQAGYAPQTARKTAASVAQHPDVVIVVNYLVGSAIAGASDSVERLIEELCRVSFTDPISIFDEDDNLLPIRQWPEDMRRSLAGLEVLEEFTGRGEDRRSIGRTKKVKFWGKLDAIQGIAKIRGYLQPERHEHTHKIDGMTGLLAEIDGSGCGPGPSRS